MLVTKKYRYNIGEIKHHVLRETRTAKVTTWPWFSRHFLHLPAAACRLYVKIGFFFGAFALYVKYSSRFLQHKKLFAEKKKKKLDR